MGYHLECNERSIWYLLLVFSLTIHYSLFTIHYAYAYKPINLPPIVIVFMKQYIKKIG